MKKKRTEVDPKYVTMLNKAYEKYSKLEIVNSTFEHFSDSCEDNKKLLVENTNSSNSNVIRKNPKVSKVDMVTKKSKNHANYGHRRYSEEENEFLLNYLENNHDMDMAQAAKELTKLMKGRTFWSIRHQLTVLRSGQTVTVKARTKKFYSLTEDKLIIDEAIKDLKQCKSLRETVVKNPLEISKSLKRAPKTISERWDPYIKCWLLQYYNKNLNQDITPMLVDLIYSNYDSVLNIDWEFVARHNEFLGYNIKGLKKKFVQAMDKAAKALHKPSYELSLKDVANYTEEYYINKKNRPKPTPTSEKRQMDCIAYFEQKISEHKISFCKK